MSYSPAFYDTIRPGCQASADIIVPLTVGDAKTVIDVGCGEGVWAHRYAAEGVRVLGIDGPHVAHTLGDQFVAHNLATELPDLGTYDLAVSLEVAEHLPPDRARSFVADLCRLAPRVLFSAAIPGQTGDGHVNCQWPAYWAKLFAEHTFGSDDQLRWTIWDDTKVEPWYRQNLLEFTAGFPYRSLRSVVHPDIWAWKP